MNSQHDRRGVERIRDAAIVLFGQKGVNGTSLKAVAAEAGVSQALVIHHFGSKDGLHRACDAHVTELMRTNKEAAVAQGPHMDPFEAFRMIDNSRPLVLYLARTLSEGGPHVARLIDDMITDAEVYTAEAERSGFIKPSVTPRERITVLILWSLGALVLHEQVHRLLGVDFLAEDLSPADYAPYMRPIIELYSQGLFEGDAYSELVDLFDTGSTPTTATDAPFDDSPHPEDRRDR